MNDPLKDAPPARRLGGIALAPGYLRRHAVVYLYAAFTTIGLFAIFQLEFNLTTLAAILTIAGYSINDTVVIYDRMRETLRKHRTMPFREP